MMIPPKELFSGSFLVLETPLGVMRQTNILAGTGTPTITQATGKPCPFSGEALGESGIAINQVCLKIGVGLGLTVQ